MSSSHLPESERRKIIEVQVTRGQGELSGFDIYHEPEKQKIRKRDVLKSIFTGKVPEAPAPAETIPGARILRYYNGQWYEPDEDLEGSDLVPDNDRNNSAKKSSAGNNKNNGNTQREPVKTLTTTASSPRPTSGVRFPFTYHDDISNHDSSSSNGGHRRPVSAETSGQTSLSSSAVQPTPLKRGADNKARRRPEWRSSGAFAFDEQGRHKVL